MCSFGVAGPYWTIKVWLGKGAQPVWRIVFQWLKKSRNADWLQVVCISSARETKHPGCTQQSCQGPSN